MLRLLRKRGFSGHRCWQLLLRTLPCFETSYSLYQSPLNYCIKLRLYTTLKSLKQSVVFDLCADIDINKEKENWHYGDTTPSLAETVQAQIDQRLDAAVENFSGDELRLLKIIQLEHSFLFSEGYAIPPPEKLTCRNWLEAMTLPSMESRLLYYTDLERLEQHPKKSPPDIINEAGLVDDNLDDENEYTIFFSRLSSDLVERAANHRLASAMTHGSVLVVDMGFDDDILSNAVDPIVDQLWNLYLINRSNQEPFHLVFTNCRFSSPIYRQFQLSCAVKARFIMATFTEQSHLDIFPRQNLVYLSSQSKQILHVVNTDRVHILGAYRDPMVRKKHSYIKAKQEGINCLKLPIDQHVNWAHQAHKDLDLDTVCEILLAVKGHGLWKEAFLSVVPSLISTNSESKKKMSKHEVYGQ